MAEEPHPTAAGEGELLEAIRGAREGRPAAVDAWFRGEHGDVYRLCFGFLADPGEAEDLAQDAMVHLLDRLPDYDPERPYRPWRDTVVLNLCRDHLRAREARARAHRRAAERGEEALEAAAIDPQRELERAEVGAVLRETLAALSPREREVFVLRDLEGRSTEEAASVLAVAPSTVRSMLTLARRRLRGLLEKRFGGALTDAGIGGLGNA